MPWVEGSLMFCSIVWFLVNLVITLFEFYGTHPVGRLYFLMMGLAFFFPPLIMHNSLHNEEAFLPPNGAWRLVIRLSYLISMPIALAVVLSACGIAQLVSMSDGVIRVLNLLMCVMLVAAAAFSARVVKKSQRKIQNAEERGYRRWVLLLYALLVLLFLPMMASILGIFPYARYLSLFSRALPILFLFVGSYFNERFTFYDIFIKSGSRFMLALIGLTVFFALTPFGMGQSDKDWAKPWLLALTLLPLTLALPWAFRKVDSWLDRVWLGRQFTPVEAGKYFLSGLHAAATEKQLVKEAESRLSEIFQAKASILIRNGDATEENHWVCSHEVPLQSSGGTIGKIQMGRRPNQAPYLCEDVALLNSMASGLSFMLENVRLRAKKMDQEKREQELMLHASRSELKALRAQINPHFLFNALNAIAGLIHKDPDRAEATVEQLAEVFRYTLRRSEKEWVRLGDEMEFVRAYLEVEQSRFGERLQVRFEIEDQVRDLRIPAMIVQTLVENAIKHGVASVRGLGIVEVRARQREDRLRLEVLDNGPGFDLDHNSAAILESGSSTGYGLRNIRERLQGYFGSDATLSLEREESSGMTVVVIEMPVLAALSPEGVSAR